MPDWLGYAGRPPPGSMLPFAVARDIVRKLKLQSQKKWKAWSKSGQRPSNIPGNPYMTYRDDGWISFPDWLGYTGVTQHKDMLPFAAARAIVRKLKLKSAKEWVAWRKTGHRPSNIPTRPCDLYRDDGWISWPDWLGYKSLREGWGSRGDPRSKKGKEMKKVTKKEPKKRKRQLAPSALTSIPRRFSSSSSTMAASDPAAAAATAATAATAAAIAFLTSSSSSSSSSSPRRPALGERVEAQYGTDADEAWFVGRVMAVNAEGTCDVHYEDGDKEVGKPWSRVRAAAVDAESGEGEELEDGELEKVILGGRQSTSEMKAIAALAWCGEGSVGVYATAIEGGEEDSDEVAVAFGGKGGGSLSSSSADTKKKKRKRQKQVSAKEQSGEEVPVSSSNTSAMRSPGR